MRRVWLLIGAFVLLYSVGSEAKKGKNNNQRNFWDIWATDNTEPVAAAGDDLFLEPEGSGKEITTHEDDEDFDVGSGDEEIVTQKPKPEDPDEDYDDYDEYNDIVTKKPDKNKPTDDEDLYDGSGEEGSGLDAYVPEKEIPIEPLIPDKSKPQLTACQQLLDTAVPGLEYVPRCTEDGDYEKQQCVPDVPDKTQYCWCVDRITGKKIPGTRLQFPVATDDKPTPNQCDFGMNLTTCVFQLVQHSQGLIGNYKPKCTADGQYEPVQCQENECWCVDMMGNEILGTFTKKPDDPDCGDKKETTLKPKSTPKPKGDNRPYKPFDKEKKKDKKPGYVIPEEDPNVIVHLGPDKIDIDSGETDMEEEEEKTSRIGDNDTVYADQVKQSPLMAKPGLLAAIIAGAVVGLLLMVLLVMFIVYRMRKKDEGSYPLDEQKYQNYPYAKAPTKEFYA